MSGKSLLGHKTNPLRACHFPYLRALYTNFSFICRYGDTNVQILQNTAGIISTREHTLHHRLGRIPGVYVCHGRSFGPDDWPVKNR